VQNYIFGGAYFNVSLFSRTTFSAPAQSMQKESAGEWILGIEGLKD
jgi:hypothetical protein